MKISIVGVGKVGSTIAYSLVTRSLASELVLVGGNPKRTYGEALDLQHAAALSPGNAIVRQGEIEATRDSRIVILALSERLNSNGPCDRMVLAEANAKLFSEVIPCIAKASPDAILLVVSNPVDILTYVALQISGFEPHRVVGTGTLLDSARYRAFLSQHLAVHPEDIRAYIMGEHGESQFPGLSAATVGGQSLGQSEVYEEAFRYAANAGHQVRESKGYTNFAVATAATMIIEAVHTDAKRTMPVSTLVDGYCGIHDVCLSLPVVMGREGIAQQLQPTLTESEKAKLIQSAHRIGEVLTPLRPLWQSHNSLCESHVQLAGPATQERTPPRSPTR